MRPENCYNEGDIKAKITCNIKNYSTVKDSSEGQIKCKFYFIMALNYSIVL